MLKGGAWRWRWSARSALDVRDADGLSRQEVMLSNIQESDWPDIADAIMIIEQSGRTMVQITGDCL